MFRDDIVKHADTYWITPCRSGTVYTKGDVINIRNEIANRRLSGNWQGLFMSYSDYVPPSSNDLLEPDFKHEGLFLVRDPNLAAARSQGTDQMSNMIKEEDKILICTYYDDDRKNLFPPGKKPKYHGLNDCAHFASECFAAGGIKCGTGGVSELLQQLMRLPYTTTKTLTYLAPYHKAKNVVASPIFKAGDALIYSSRKGVHHHSSVYMGNGKRSMHTVSNHPNHATMKGEWTSEHADEDHDHYTLIHLSLDDRINPLDQLMLAGWWKTDAPSGSGYIYLANDGIAGSFLQQSAAAPNFAAAKEKGYWFVENSKVFVTFSKSNLLYEFSLFQLINRDGVIRGTLDGVVSVSVTRA